MIHARADYNRMQDPIGKIAADEPVFLIRAQDIVSGDAVRAWADLNDKVGGDAEASCLAREHAGKMDAWPLKKKCDLPRSSNR